MSGTMVDSKVVKERPPSRYKVRTIPFLRQLKRMIENEPGVIKWDRGNIIIPDPKILEMTLPRYYKHNNYASFQRQLNNFGYHRKFAHFIVNNSGLLDTVYHKLGGTPCGGDIEDLLKLRPVLERTSDKKRDDEHDPDSMSPRRAVHHPAQEEDDDDDDEDEEGDPAYYRQSSLQPELPGGCSSSRRWCKTEAEEGSAAFFARYARDLAERASLIELMPGYSEDQRAKKRPPMEEAYSSCSSLGSPPDQHHQIEMAEEGARRSSLAPIRRRPDSPRTTTASSPKSKRRLDNGLDSKPAPPASPKKKATKKRDGTDVVEAVGALLALGS